MSKLKFEYEPIVVSFTPSNKEMKDDGTDKILSILKEVMGFGFERGYSFQANAGLNRQNLNNFDWMRLVSEDPELEFEARYRFGNVDATGYLEPSAVFLEARMSSSAENRFGDYVSLRDLLAQHGEVTGSSEQTYESFLGVGTPYKPIKRFLRSCLLFPFGEGFAYENPESEMQSIADQIQENLKTEGLDFALNVEKTSTRNLDFEDKWQISGQEGGWVLDLEYRPPGRDEEIALMTSAPYRVWDASISVDFNVERNFGEQLSGTYQTIVDVLSNVKGMKRAKAYRTINGERQPIK